jgi:hypothetical protein
MTNGRRRDRKGDLQGGVTTIDGATRIYAIVGDAIALARSPLSTIRASRSPAGRMPA